MITFTCPKCGKTIQRYHDESLRNHFCTPMTTPTRPHPIDEQVEQAPKAEVVPHKAFLSGFAVRLSWIGDFNGQRCPKSQYIYATDLTNADGIASSINEAIRDAVRIAVEPLQQELFDETKRTEQLEADLIVTCPRCQGKGHENPVCNCCNGSTDARSAIKFLEEENAKLRQQLAARDAEIERVVKAEREACKQIAADQLKLEQISGDGTARTILQLIDARTTPSTEGGR